MLQMLNFSHEVADIILMVKEVFWGNGMMGKLLESYDEKSLDEGQENPIYTKVENVIYLHQIKAVKSTKNNNSPEQDQQLRKKILHIDEESHYLRFFEESLKSDYQFVYAQDGFTGLKLAKKETFDLILCRIDLNIIDGIKLINEFQRRHIHVPFIFYGDKDDPQQAKQALRCGAYNYIVTPLSIHDLSYKMEMAISLYLAEEYNHANDQQKAHIYNILKKYYYDVDRIVLSIQYFRIPIDLIEKELEKKMQTGKCIFDDLHQLKYFRVNSGV